MEKSWKDINAANHLCKPWKEDNIRFFPSMLWCFIYLAEKKNKYTFWENLKCHQSEIKHLILARPDNTCWTCRSVLLGNYSIICEPVSVCKLSPPWYCSYKNLKKSPKTPHHQKQRNIPISIYLWGEKGKLTNFKKTRICLLAKNL